MISWTDRQSDTALTLDSACVARELRLVAPALFGLALAMGVASGALAQAPETETVVTDAQGNKTVLIRWAIDHPDNIVTLRQPLGYTSLLDGLARALRAQGYGDRTLKNRQSAVSFSFSALLPDLRPRTKENVDDFTHPGGGDKVEGLIESVIYEGNPIRERDTLRIRAENARNSLISVTPQRPHTMRLVERPEHFGLRRIGPDPIVPAIPGSSVELRDLYFLGDRPETSPVLIVCEAEGVPTREDDPRAWIVPQCHHHFAIEALSAVVRIRYRRVFLASWQSIQVDTTRIVVSFLSGK